MKISIKKLFESFELLTFSKYVRKILRIDNTFSRSVLWVSNAQQRELFVIFKSLLYILSSKSLLLLISPPPMPTHMKTTFGSRNSWYKFFLDRIKLPKYYLNLGILNKFCVCNNKKLSCHFKLYHWEINKFYNNWK